MLGTRPGQHRGPRGHRRAAALGTPGDGHQGLGHEHNPKMGTLQLGQTEGLRKLSRGLRKLLPVPCKMSNPAWEHGVFQPCVTRARRSNSSCLRCLLLGALQTKTSSGGAQETDLGRLRPPAPAFFFFSLLCFPFLFHEPAPSILFPSGKLHHRPLGLQQRLPRAPRCSTMRSGGLHPCSPRLLQMSEP